MADETCFIDAIKLELLTLTFQSDIVRIWAHIKLSSFNYKANALTNWNWHLQPPLSIYNIYPSLHIAITILYPFAKMYKKWLMFRFFYKRLREA